MKKKLLLLSLVGVFLFLSCDDESMNNTDNPFVGTWENENGDRYVFTETTVTLYTPDGSVWWSGTYTYNETHITITMDYRAPVPGAENWENPFTNPYSFENDVMIILSPYTKVSGK